MFLLPLLSGAIAIFSPFFGIMAMMLFCAKALGPAIVSPQRAISAFFVVPLLVMLFDGSSPTTPLIVLDAILGAGAVAYVFLIVLRKTQYLNYAFLAAALVIMLYSIVRTMLFGSVLDMIYQEGIQTMQAQLPGFLDGQYMELSARLWKYLQPAFWGVAQISALLVSFVIFHKTIKIPLKASEMKFPVFYNFLILAVLPLYFVPSGRATFVNAMILLCTIPLIQGFFASLNGLARVFESKIIRGIIMFFLLIYAFVPLTLYGFADSWMSHSNKPRGGKTA